MKKLQRSGEGRHHKAHIVRTEAFSFVSEEARKVPVGADLHQKEELLVDPLPLRVIHTGRRHKADKVCLVFTLLHQPYFLDHFTNFALFVDKESLESIDFATGDIFGLVDKSVSALSELAGNLHLETVNLHDGVGGTKNPGLPF